MRCLPRCSSGRLPEPCDTSLPLHPGASAMRPSTALHTHRDAIRAIALSHRVTNVRVFGSVVHGDDTENSDLGILVEVLTPKGLPAKFRDQVIAQAQAL